MLVSGISISFATTSATGDTFVSAFTFNINSSFTVLLTLRVAALYRNVRGVLWLLWLSFALFHGLRLAIILYGDVVIFSTLKFNQQYQ
jgi:hypothetical protein